MKTFVNKLILGDNLEKLKEIESESIDLIYADPPFFSNRNYEVIWGDEGEIRSFEDRWAGDIEHYIGWLRERVEEMYRVLKPTGSLFLHCDWHASHYIKVDILDRKDLFTKNNFRNEIVWCYKSRPQSKKYFGRKHDVIFFYTKTDNYTFNWQEVVRSLSDVTIKKYRLKDDDGRLYRLQGRGIKGSPIRSAKDVDPKWEITNPELIVRDYLDEKIGVALEDWWDDIDAINQNSKELIGYPTQKPEKLLQRIIECASNEGDIVLDPFVGGGTTVAVADKLNRKWIGIDQSVMAVKVTDYRLKKQRDAFSQDYELVLRTFNHDTLRNMDAWEFEKFIIEQFGGNPNAKKGGDSGIDGKKDKIPIQVKRSDNIGVNVVKNFWASLQQFDKKLFDKNVKEKKIAGYIIAFSFGKGAIEEVARLKKENIIIELKKVGDIVNYGKPPKISLSASELENNEYLLIAQAENEDNIVLYSWDTNHNEEKGFSPDILMDKEGKQKKKFQQGEYIVAVEGIDKSGLDAIGKTKIKVKK
jgi:site-specific DNA-methyltransferase (adenine-specific)